MAQRRLGAVIGAAMTAATLLTGILAPAAAAQSSTGAADSHAPAGGAQVVVFGDSHTAGTNMPMRTDERGCAKGAENWPDQLRANLGLSAGDLIDVSCSGASINSDGFHFSDEVRQAEARGALGERTRDIFIQLGKNDQWGGSGVNLLQSVQACLLDVTTDCGDRAVASGKMQDPAAVTAENYAARMKPVIDYLSYYAPNAEITIVGYQEVVPRGGSEVCIRIGGSPLVNHDAPALVSFMNRLDMAAAGAAGILGVSFVDLRTATEGHGSCSADPWVNGVLDARTELIGGPWHPSKKGDSVTASILRDRVNA